MTAPQKDWLKRYSAAQKKLKQEILLRKAAEKKLKDTTQHYEHLIKDLRNKKANLKHLSRQILIAQEEDRKKISRELHDEIAQNLSGINVYLAVLKLQVKKSTVGLAAKITRAERLVEKSVDKVHRFARDLRPTLLDDLGLIPALRSDIASFTKRTGVPVRLNAFHGLEQLSNAKKTVLYRVVQSALVNVAKHAEATEVKVDIQRKQPFIQMTIADNGKSFNVERMLFVNKNKRLGLLGMRERVEMVDGEFTIDSIKGSGTTISVRIPFNVTRSTAKK